MSNIDDMEFTMNHQFMSRPGSNRVNSVDKQVVSDVHKDVNNVQDVSEMTNEMPKKAVSKSTKKSASKKSKNTVNTVEPAYSVVRNVPTMVLQQIRAEFPDAANQTDALMAYIVCHGDGAVVDKAKLVLTEAQMDLVKSWGGSSYSDIVQQISVIAKRMETMKHTSDIIEFLMSYIVFDRLGFRQSNPRSVQEADLREDGVMDVMIKAEQQVEGFQREKDNILGRPIR